jgi:hypothetical protein
MQEPVKIKSMITPVNDSRANRGVTEKVTDPIQIEAYLSDPESFTDDEVFVSESGFRYSIDELIDLRRVSVQGREPIEVLDC